MNTLATIAHYCPHDDFTPLCEDSSETLLGEYLLIKELKAGLGTNYGSWEEDNIMDRIEHLSKIYQWSRGNQQMSVLEKFIIGFQNEDRTARIQLQKLYCSGTTTGLRRGRSAAHPFPETKNYSTVPNTHIYKAVYITVGKLSKFLDYRFTALLSNSHAILFLSELITIYEDRIRYAPNTLLDRRPVVHVGSEDILAFNNRVATATMPARNIKATSNRSPDIISEDNTLIDSICSDNCSQCCSEDDAVESE